MFQHPVRNAILGIPLAALSFGRAAVAASPVTLEVLSPPAVTQVMSNAELSQSRLPTLTQQANPPPPAKRREGSGWGYILGLLGGIPLAIGMERRNSERRSSD